MKYLTDKVIAGLFLLIWIGYILLAIAVSLT